MLTGHWLGPTIAMRESPAPLTWEQEERLVQLRSHLGYRVDRGHGEVAWQVTDWAAYGQALLLYADGGVRWMGDWRVALGHYRMLIKALRECRIAGHDLYHDFTEEQWRNPAGSMTTQGFAELAKSSPQENRA